ncbi:hypothetical protein [Chitinophaga sp.]|uniref:hypothetical protein n=1 Tax=Chitinophaga sp. TaxID=1869181 RepID=UPI002F9551DB
MKYFLLLLLSGPCIQLFAQQHNLSGVMSSCRYVKKNKNYNYEGSSPCLACVKEEKLEREAKVAEDKRVEAVRAAADKKRSDEEQARFKAERAAALEANKSTTVYVNMPESKTKSVVPDKPEKVAVDPKKVLMFGTAYPFISYIGANSYQGNYFRNVNKDTVLRNDEWLMTYGAGAQAFKTAFPPNIGIVTLKKKKQVNGSQRKGEMYISDIVDAQGKRLFNDESITAVVHMADNWFIIIRGFFNCRSIYSNYVCDDVVIYNLQTKETIPVKKYTGVGYNQGGHVINQSDGILSIEDRRPSSGYKYCFFAEYDIRKYVVYYVNNDGTIEATNHNY